MKWGYLHLPATIIECTWVLHARWGKAYTHHTVNHLTNNNNINPVKDNVSWAWVEDIDGYQVKKSLSKFG